MKYWKEILIVILIGICLLCISKCSDERKAKEQESNNFLSEKEGLSVRMSRQSQLIYGQNQIITQDAKEAQKLIDKVEGLKKINQQVKATVTTKIVEVQVPIDRPVYIKDSLGNEYLKVPAKFIKVDPWFSLNGEIQDKGVVKFDSVTFINKPTITFGTKKKGIKDLFKKSELEVTFQDQNPYTRLQSMSNIRIEDKRKNNIHLGLQIGYGVTKSGLSPYLGIGLTFNK